MQYPLAQKKVTWVTLYIGKFRLPFAEALFGPIQTQFSGQTFIFARIVRLFQ